MDSTFIVVLWKTEYFTLKVFGVEDSGGKIVFNHQNYESDEQDFFFQQEFIVILIFLCRALFLEALSQS